MDSTHGAVASHMCLPLGQDTQVGRGEVAPGGVDVAATSPPAAWGRSVAQLTGAPRRGEPSGGYQGDEEFVWMLGCTDSVAGCGEMADAD